MMGERRSIAALQRHPPSDLGAGFSPASHLRRLISSHMELSNVKFSTCHCVCMMTVRWELEFEEEDCAQLGCEGLKFC